MERRSYQIKTARGVETVRGYVFRFGAHNYGVTNETPSGAKLCAWIITELSSGASVYPHGDFKREKALENLPQYIGRIPNYGELIERLTDDAHGGALNADIEPKTALLYARNF